MTDPTCIFCRIISGEIPAETVFEDEYVKAVLDVHPIAPGHTIVLPKEHAPTLLELPTELMSGVFTGVQKVTAALEAALGPDGFTIGINHGRHAGQAVDHLHIHIIPRWEKDGGGSIHSVVNNTPKESLADIKSKIQQSLNNPKVNASQ